MTTSNDKLDRVELHRIDEFGKREAVRLEARLQAIVGKLVSIGAELEDPHTCQCTLHLGRRGDQDVVKVEVSKQY